MRFWQKKKFYVEAVFLKSNKSIFQFYNNLYLIDRVLNKFSRFMCAENILWSK